MVTGFPNETYAEEIKGYLENLKKQLMVGVGKVVTFGRVTNSAILEFGSPAEATSFRERMRGESAIPEFKESGGEMHKVYFGPRNSKEEDRRQMMQRRIRNVLKKKFEEGGKMEEIYIERGKGTVRVGRSLVAMVAKDAGGFQLFAEALKKWDLVETDVKGEMEVAINRV